MTMECLQVGDAVVCRKEMEVVSRQPDGDPRWCFRERKTRTFELVITAPVGISYYGPNPAIRCTSCGGRDTDLFPGREREWSED